VATNIIKTTRNHTLEKNLFALIENLVDSIIHLFKNKLFVFLIFNILDTIILTSSDNDSYMTHI